MHIATNESLTTNVELWATYLVPGAPGSAIRMDEALPGRARASGDEDEEEDDD